MFTILVKQGIKAYKSMMVKSVKMLELHYPMIQFLIMKIANEHARISSIIANLYWLTDYVQKNSGIKILGVYSRGLN